MAALCFRAVSERLRKAAPTSALPPPLTSSWSTSTDTFNGLECPVFVCFKHATTNNLRGCVGTFSSAELHQQLRKYACAAAFEDSRFQPISSESELSTLRCTVSLLHTFEVLPQGKWDDWEVGVHGVQCSLASGGKRFRSTFLPSVAKDQRWDRRTTLAELLRKAGVSGDVTDSVLARVEVTRYQESSCSASYEELFLTNRKYESGGGCAVS
jgi:AMME syndrome candidate gene 1 protein